MENAGLSASDVLALTRGNEGFLEGNGIIILILFFLIFGFNGNGFGRDTYSGANAPATQGQMTDQFNFEALRQGQADGISAVKESQYENGTLVKDVAYNNLSQIRDIESMVAQNGYKLAECCCATQKEILASRANDDKNTCAITNAIHTEGETTRALINANEMAKIRDELDQTRLILSNKNQSDYILSSIGRYVTNPPCPPPCNPCYNSCGCSMV